MIGKNKGKAKVKIKPSKKKKYDPSLKGLFRFLWKTFVIAMFILYLIIGSIGTAFWGKVTAHRSLNVENLDTRVENYLRQGKNLNAVFTAYVQEIDKSEKVIEELLPIMPKLGTFFFFEMARRYTAIDNPKEAIFWHMLGGVHARYDSLRCKGIKDNELLKILIGSTTTQYITLHIAANPDIIKPTQERVLTWIEKNGLNGQPSMFCGMAKLYYQDENITGELKPKILWSGILEQLKKTVKNEAIDTKKDINDNEEQK